MRFLPIGLFLLLGALFFLGIYKTSPEHLHPLIGRPAPEPDALLLGSPEKPPSLSDLRGRPVLVNFYASWCAPCLAEQPALSALAQAHHLLIYGIAWKDSAANVKDWLEKHGNPYGVTAMDVEGKSGVAYGITGVPESFLVDANGIILWHTASALTQELVDRELLPLLSR